MRVLAFLLFALWTSASPAGAVEPDEILDNPVLEVRARAISRQLRCLVCQNENIDDSNADLAHDLRLLVRERIVKGDTDAQVIAYIVDRYGDFVLLRPPLQPNTLLLWAGPLLVLGIGGLSIFVFLKRSRLRSAVFSPDLTPEERAKVKNVINHKE